MVDNNWNQKQWTNERKQRLEQEHDENADKQYVVRGYILLFVFVPFGLYILFKLFFMFG